jgi:hypothetical protein
MTWLALAHACSLSPGLCSSQVTDVAYATAGRGEYAYQLTTAAYMKRTDTGGGHSLWIALGVSLGAAAAPELAALLAPETATAAGAGADAAAPEDATDAGGGLTRVGRWMSPAEHEAMTDTGIVQEGAGGVTNVASPAAPEAYMRQAASGSRYVEFDVPEDSLSPGGKAGWVTIRGPNSFWARGGLALPEMPPALNIEWLLTKP